jgi:hypothetical protein
MQDTTFWIVIAVIAIWLALAITFLIARNKIEDKVINWLNGPYEKSLHEAARELIKTERWAGPVVFNWVDNFYLIGGLRLYWLPRVYETLNKLHADKVKRLDGAVEIIAIPRNTVEMRLRPWTIALLDSGGREQGKLCGWSRLTADDPAALLRVFQDHPDAASLLIKDHNGKAIRQVTMKEIS